MSDNKRKGSRLQGANWTNQAPKVHESLRSKFLREIVEIKNKMTLHFLF